MKKLLLTSALAIIATLSSYGQGSVAFANSATTKVTDSAGVALPTTAGYVVELMYAPDGTPAAAFDLAATRVGGTTTIFPVAGQFNGGNRTVTTLSPAGGFGLFQVRAWQGAAGASYAEAMLTGNANYQAGKSGIFRVDTGDPTTVPPGTPANLVANGLTGFSVSPIPEPSVIALGLLGAGALLMLRRRK